MIMNKKMTKFNVEMYNEKMTQLDSTIDNLNEILDLFDSGDMEINSDSFRRFIDSPAEIFESYISYEYTSMCKYSDYGIEKDEYDSPYYEECYKDIASEMITILKAYNKLCGLLPYIKEAYNSSLFFIRKEDEAPKVVKTQNVELRIMRQCAEYENGCSMIVKF